MNVLEHIGIFNPVNRKIKSRPHSPQELQESPQEPRERGGCIVSYPRSVVGLCGALCACCVHCDMLQGSTAENAETKKAPGGVNRPRVLFYDFFAQSKMQKINASAAHNTITFRTSTL